MNWYRTIPRSWLRVPGRVEWTRRGSCISVITQVWVTSANIWAWRAGASTCRYARLNTRFIRRWNRPLDGVCGSIELSFFFPFLAKERILLPCTFYHLVPTFGVTESYSAPSCVVACRELTNDEKIDKITYLIERVRIRVAPTLFFYTP